MHFISYIFIVSFCSLNFRLSSSVPCFNLLCLCYSAVSSHPTLHHFPSSSASFPNPTPSISSHPFITPVSLCLTLYLSVIQSIPFLHHSFPCHVLLSLPPFIPAWLRHRDIPDLDLSLLPSNHCSSSQAPSPAEASYWLLHSFPSNSVIPQMNLLNFHLYFKWDTLTAHFVMWILILAFS